MNLRSSVRGFLALLSAQALLANDDWRVSYTTRNVCTLRESMVDLSCTYRHPYNVQHRPNTVTLWFTKAENSQPVDLLNDTDYRGRVEYSCGEISCSWYGCSGACSLRIRYLRQSDSGVYKFGFRTPQPGGEYTGEPGVTLTVTDLQVKSYSIGSTRTELWCDTGCVLGGRPRYIWFKNELEVQREHNVNHWVSSQSADSYSCAVEGHENLLSPPVYAPKPPSVTISTSCEITERSSVTLICSSDANPAASYSWFRVYTGGYSRNINRQPHLKFRSIKSSNSGQYRCEAKNTLGKTSAIISVNGKSLWATDDWRVSYSPSNVCALGGSTVEINCTYEYPKNVQHRPNTVTLWFTKAENSQPVDLQSDRYSCREIRCTDCRCSGACSLRISDLGQSDSGVYKFRFTTPKPGGEYTGEPGVNLTVTDLQVKSSPQYSTSDRYSTSTLLQCLSRCGLAGDPHYIWFKNQLEVHQDQNVDYWVSSQSGDSYSCAVQGHDHLRSLPVYAPKTPSVTARPSGEITEGSSVTLICSSDANPAASYSWFKDNTDGSSSPIDQGKQLILERIQPSNSGQYRCEASNNLGYTSESISINVKYAPKTPSLTASPSDEIEEGSSVTLICSSDANPAASYSWFKEHQDLGQSGQNYTITYIRSKLGGNYSCQAQNAIGRRNSTFWLIKVRSSSSSSQTARVALTTSGVLLATIFLLAFLWMRRNRASRKACGPGGRPDTMEELPPLPVYGNLSAVTDHLAPAAKREPTEEQDDQNYASIQISASKKQEVPLSLVGSSVQSDRADAVTYSVINFKRPNTVPKGHESKETDEISELYSTVKKH